VREPDHHGQPTSSWERRTSITVRYHPDTESRNLDPFVGHKLNEIFEIADRVSISGWKEPGKSDIKAADTKDHNMMTGVHHRVGSCEGILDGETAA
jgi:hypothetical protein